MRCSYFLWRFGKSSEGWLHFENSGSFFVFISWLFYVFMTNHFVDYFDKGSVTLIDLLFGVPIIISAKLPEFSTLIMVIKSSFLSITFLRSFSNFI